MKLNIGAGKDIKKGFINHDIVDLPNIDLVFDLNYLPWPIENEKFDEIIANDVIEHLDDFMKTMEEIYRITKVDGVISLTVPYWNSVSTHIDPTHKRGFHEDTFKFFDPNSHYCKERGYYTHARFEVVSEKLQILPFYPFFWPPKMNVIKIKNHLAKKIISFIANTFLSNLILGLELKLKKIKNE